jgi:hypothetical protein
MVKRSSMIAALMLLAAAIAQQAVISPLAIVLNPRPAFDVNVWVDRDETGAERPGYQVGEPIRFGVQVSEDAYVYLFNLRSDGQIQQILPNRFDRAGEDNFLRAGESRTFPPDGARYSFQVEPPEGLERIIALASKRELSTQELVGFQADAAFATGIMEEGQFARTLAAIVERVPQEEWVADTAAFYVGDPPERPEFGTLQIESTPGDARTFVDGEFVGYTPVVFDVRPGERHIRVEHPEFRDFEATATVEGGDAQRVSAALREVPRRGSLLVIGNVGGAIVTLDGEEVGRLADGTGELHVPDLPPGEYHVRVSAPGFQTVEELVAVRADESSVVQVWQGRVEAEAPPRPDDAVFRHVELQPYPGAATSRIREEVDRLEVTFDTADDLDAVYGHFHQQLADWRRVVLDVGPDRVMAEYLRADARLRLDLHQLDPRGRYELSVSLGD